MDSTAVRLSNDVSDFLKLYSLYDCSSFMNGNLESDKRAQVKICTGKWNYLDLLVYEQSNTKISRASIIWLFLHFMRKGTFLTTYHVRDGLCPWSLQGKLCIDLLFWTLKLYLTCEMIMTHCQPCLSFYNSSILIWIKHLGKLENRKRSEHNQMPTSKYY